MTFGLLYSKFGNVNLYFHSQYPVCWQTECKKGFPDEKEGFTELVKDLSVEFRPKGLLLSTAVSPSKQIIDAGYDVPTLSEYFGIKLLFVNPFPVKLNSF